MCARAPSAAEPRGRPPPWKNPRLQPLHSAVHHPGTRISHHQPGHRRRQVADFLSSFLSPIGVESLCSVSRSVSQSADELARAHLRYFLLLFGLVSKKAQVAQSSVSTQTPTVWISLHSSCRSQLGKRNRFTRILHWPLGGHSVLFKSFWMKDFTQFSQC